MQLWGEADLLNALTTETVTGHWCEHLLDHIYTGQYT